MSPRKPTGNPRGRPKEPERKRVALTLELEMYQTLVEFAEANEMRVATAITDFLTELAPQIQQITAAINKAKELPEEAIEDVKEHLLETQQDINQISIEFHKSTRKTPLK